MKIIEIKDPSNEHLEALKGLLHQQMIDIGSEKKIETLDTAINNALKKESRARFFIGFQDTVPVGLAFLNICSGIESEGDYIWLNEIQVRKEYRGLEIGKQLLKFIQTWAKKNNYKNILGVTSFENSVSQKLFSSQGFDVSEMVWLNLTV